MTRLPRNIRRYLAPPDPRRTPSGPPREADPHPPLGRPRPRRGAGEVEQPAERDLVHAGDDDDRRIRRHGAKQHGEPHDLLLPHGHRRGHPRFAHRHDAQKPPHGRQVRGGDQQAVRFEV
eukprot:1196098-Prorocentrum_minimum.AAC.3